MQPEAEWLPVPGFSAYEVSTAGQVRSHYRYWHRGCRIVRRTRLLSPKVGKHGYQELTLCTEVRHHSRLVHLLVLEAFRGVRPSDMYARHLNGNRLDNRLENLVWGTHLQNEQDKKRHGTLLSGSLHPRAKIDEAKAREMHRLRRNRLTLKAIGERFGVSADCVGSIMHGRTWRHVHPDAT